MPTTVGRRERVDLPDFGLRRVRAKVDTGARTTALGVISVSIRGTDDGPVADVVVRRSRLGRLRRRTLPVLKTTWVKNSSGTSELRPVVETTVRMGSLEKRVRMTLTDRTGMSCVMLLGRSALSGDFVVDVSSKYLLGR